MRLTPGGVTRDFSSCKAPVCDPDVATLWPFSEHVAPAAPSLAAASRCRVGGWRGRVVQSCRLAAKSHIVAQQGYRRHAACGEVRPRSPRSCSAIQFTGRPRVRPFGGRFPSRLNPTLKHPFASRSIGVTFVDRDGERMVCRAPLGQNLLEVAHANNVDLEVRHRRSSQLPSHQPLTPQAACAGRM